MTSLSRSRRNAAPGRKPTQIGIGAEGGVTPIINFPSLGSSLNEIPLDQIWESKMKNVGFYIVMPISLLVLPYVFNAALDGAPFYFNKESGAVENITAILLAVAIVVTLRALFRRKPDPNTQPFKKFTSVWLVLYTLGCIYFLGEEISWGQHLFQWSTPEAWLEYNDQGETNLHNTSGLFDQVPRTIVTFSIIVGGLFAPFIGRFRATREESEPTQWSTFLSHFMPGVRCVTAAFCVFFLSVHDDKLYELFNSSVPAVLQIAVGEVKESLIAMFILVYIVDFSQRDFERHNPSDSAPADT